MQEHTPPSGTPAGLVRRLASLVYDVLLLAAVLFVAGFLFLLVAHDAQSGGTKLIFQAYLLLCIACYFAWFWLHGGQTLPMKTWRLRLVSQDGAPISPRQVIIRLVAALVGFSLGGLTIIWAIFDRDKQLLHDRLAGTRIIRCHWPV